MALFSSSEFKENTYTENGYIIGVDSHLIYQVPKGQFIYTFPNSSIGIVNLDNIKNINSSIKESFETVEEINIPSSFKYLKGDFQFCKQLERFNIAEGVEIIECYLPKKVNTKLPSTVKKILTSVYPHEEQLVLPEGLVQICNNFCSNNDFVKSLEIFGNLKYLPTNAFSQCKNLERVLIKEGVQTSAINVFEGSNKLAFISLPSTFNSELFFGIDYNPEEKQNSSLTEKEDNHFLTIEINRNESKYQFSIKRSCQPKIKITGNELTIQYQSKRLILDITKLKNKVYKIENDALIPIRSNVEKTVENQSGITIEKSNEEILSEAKINEIIIEGCKSFIVNKPEFILLTTEQKTTLITRIKDIYHREYQKNKRALKEQIVFENYYTDAIATLLKENFQYLFNSLIMNRPDYQNTKPEIRKIIEERIKDEYLKNYKNSKSLSFNTSFFETICSEIINTNQNIEENEIGLVEKSKNLLSGIFPNEDLDNYSSSPESKDLRQLKTKEELIEDEQYLKTILAMDDKLTIKQKIIAMQAIEKLYESYYLIVNSVHQNEEVISR